MTPTDAKRPLQLNDPSQLRHFLSLDGLPASCSPRFWTPPTLPRGWRACGEEGSAATRQDRLQRLLRELHPHRTTFELAAKRLSADVITLNVSTSSTSKGETLTDTLRNPGSHGGGHVRGAPRGLWSRAFHRRARQRTWR